MNSGDVVLLMAASSFIATLIGVVIGHKAGFREGLDAARTRTDESPPQPTISCEAMDRESQLRRSLGDAAMNRVLGVTAVRNHRGMPHVAGDEMDDICSKMEAAAMEVALAWQPEAGEDQP